ncbi:hypothetical protein LINGRAHAP2_LOCUS22151 [Linum grandiflorum]
MDDHGTDSSASGSTTTNNHNNRIWTNEKHLNFLNSLEATFVRTMLIENNYSPSTRHRRHSYDHDLRLDRYLPDSLESTLDSASHRPKKSATAPSADHKRSRRLSFSSSRSNTRSQIAPKSDPSRDQVVPQLSIIRTNDKQTD